MIILKQIKFSELSSSSLSGRLGRAYTSSGVYIVIITNPQTNQRVIKKLVIQKYCYNLAAWKNQLLEVPLNHFCIFKITYIYHIEGSNYFKKF